MTGQASLIGARVCLYSNCCSQYTGHNARHHAPWLCAAHNEPGSMHYGRVLFTMQYETAATHNEPCVMATMCSEVNQSAAYPNK